MSDPVETMNQIMDRRKIVKTKIFKKDYNNNWTESNQYGGTGLEFVNWQRSNPGIKVINTSVTQKTILPTQQTYTPPPVAQPTYEEYMHVSYEEYEDVMK